jgi:ornithine carbamoyltransferase
MSKDLLAPADLTPADVDRLLDVAGDLKRNPRRTYPDLATGLVVMYFTKPATGVRTTFSAAATRLGASSVVLGPPELAPGLGTDADAVARLVNSYASVVVARADVDQLQRLADQTTIPVIAGLSDTQQPCQSLADLLTLQQAFGSLAGLRVGFLGDGGPLAHSLAEACALAGVELRLATSPSRPADPEILDRARRIGAETGGHVQVVDDAFAAVEGVDAIYTSGWTVDEDPDRPTCETWMTTYPITRLLMSCAAPDAILLHTQPTHRSFDLSRQVLCDPRSRIREQAENRVHCAAAMLTTCMRQQFRDASSRALLSVC